MTLNLHHKKKALVLKYLQRHRVNPILQLEKLHAFY